jgi:hypothetical protein
MLPEVIAGYIFPKRKWENNLTAYRVLCGIGVVGNLMMMMMANLVGFAVGVDGLKSIIHGIFRDYSGVFEYISYMKPTNNYRYSVFSFGIGGSLCGHPGHV